MMLLPSDIGEAPGATDTAVTATAPEGGSSSLLLVVPALAEYISPDWRISHPHKGGMSDTFDSQDAYIVIWGYGRA